jgi:hypothetical protein
MGIHPYPFQQHAGRFVVGILGNESAGEGLFEDRLAQAVGAALVGIDLGFGSCNDGEATFDFGDDLVLFGERGERNAKCFHVSNI